MISEVSRRYASALFEAAKDPSQHSKTLQELRELGAAFLADSEIGRFVQSPLVTAKEKVSAVQKALEAGGASEAVKHLALLLAARNRLADWNQVVEAFEARTDEENGMVRGTVRSAASLGPEQRQAIEARVAQMTGKKVVLEYKVDEALLGGLIAEVGSLRFDDSLETQLRLMNESLKRSAH